jgi:hypothetical protein
MFMADSKLTGRGKFSVDGSVVVLKARQYKAADVHGAQFPEAAPNHARSMRAVKSVRILPADAWITDCHRGFCLWEGGSRDNRG